MRPDETNLYTTLEPTLSSNPNVYFQRGGGVHPGMMYWSTKKKRNYSSQKRTQRLNLVTRWKKKNKLI